MRVFVALELDPDIRRRIQGFVGEICGLAPDVRWVSEESLHVTLQFIGEKPEETVKQIEQTLKSVPIDPFPLRFAGAGFFPAPEAARLFWIGIEAGDGLAQLAKRVEESLAEIGIRKENRAFSPHLTLARQGGGSAAPGWRKRDQPNRQFLKLQAYLRKHPAPDFGTMTAREFFLYRSQLSRKGSRYTKIARFEFDPGKT